MLVLSHVKLVDPSLTLMRDGVTILCSERVDFVYTMDINSKAVLAAESYPHDAWWNAQQQAVFDLTRLPSSLLMEAHPNPSFILTLDSRQYVYADYDIFNGQLGH